MIGIGGATSTMKLAKTSVKCQVVDYATHVECVPDVLLCSFERFQSVRLFIQSFMFYPSISIILFGSNQQTVIEPDDAGSTLFKKHFRQTTRKQSTVHLSYL